MRLIPLCVRKDNIRQIKQQKQQQQQQQNSTPE
jgi:hypothetical protein